MSRLYILSFFLFMVFCQLGQSQIVLSKLFPLDTAQEISVKQTYEMVTSMNKYNSRIKTRSRYSHKIDSSVRYQIEDNEDTLRKTGKVIYIFDSLRNRQITLSHNVHLDGSIHGRDYTVYHFDEEDRLIRQSANGWDGVWGEWKETTAYLIRILNYDTNGNLTRLDGYSSAEDMSSGKLLGYATYEYDSLNILKKNSNYYDRGDIKLTLGSEVYYKHDSLNNLTGTVVFRDRVNRGGWTKDDSISYAYNEYGWLKKEDKYNYEDSVWVYYYTDEYWYHDDGRIDSIYFNGARPENGIHNYAYTVNNDLESVTQKVAGQVPPWARPEFYRRIYTYETFVDTKDILLPYGFFNFKHTSHGHMITTIDDHDLRWNDDFSRFDKIYESNNYYTEFFYSELNPSSTIEDLKTIEVHVSPNPTSDFLTFTLSGISESVHLEIHDISGNRISQQVITSGARVNVSAFPAGVYVYTVRSSDGVGSGKIVKE